MRRRGKGRRKRLFQITFYDAASSYAHVARSCNASLPDHCKYTWLPRCWYAHSSHAMCFHGQATCVEVDITRVQATCRLKTPSHRCIARFRPATAYSCLLSTRQQHLLCWKPIYRPAFFRSRSPERFKCKSDHSRDRHTVGNSMTETFHAAVAALYGADSSKRTEADAWLNALKITISPGTWSILTQTLQNEASLEAVFVAAGLVATRARNQWKELSVEEAGPIQASVLCAPSDTHIFWLEAPGLTLWHAQMRATVYTRTRSSCPAPMQEQTHCRRCQGRHACLRGKPSVHRTCRDAMPIRACNSGTRGT